MGEKCGIHPGSWPQNGPAMTSPSSKTRMLDNGRSSYATEDVLDMDDHGAEYYVIVLTNELE